jgi:hypothetical protein
MAFYSFFLFDIPCKRLILRKALGPLSLDPRHPATQLDNPHLTQCTLESFHPRDANDSCPVRSTVLCPQDRTRIVGKCDLRTGSQQARQP